MASVTLELIRYARDLRFDALPNEAVETARHCLLDYIGVGLAGADDPLVSILIDTLGTDLDGDAQLLGHTQRTTATNAAMINGAAAHALDFDDTHTIMNGHASVPVLPALLALAELRGANGKQVLEALIAGIETECRLGAMLGIEHYAAGFHTTGTVGTFGAAAACARLMNLDETGWQNAFGLAATQAAGLKSMFGTMAKPFHAGRAASCGLLAALLAEKGFTAAPDAIETTQGFASTHGSPPSSVEILERHADRFLIRETLFKYHAACYLTHAAINASAAIASQLLANGVHPSEITSVTVTVNPMLFQVCNIRNPVTGLEGKFSLRATTALALLGDDTCDIVTFSDERMEATDLVAMRDRISVDGDEGLGGAEARIVVTSGDRSWNEVCDTGTPASDLSEQRAALRRKFARLVGPILGETSAGVLADTILSVDDQKNLSSMLNSAAG